MVLQCKVFLIVTLQKYSPLLSKKRTFIRRVKNVVSHLNRSSKKLQHATPHKDGLNSSRSTSDFSHGDVTSVSSAAAAVGGGPTSSTGGGYTTPDRRLSRNSSFADLESAATTLEGEISQTQAMRMFTKLPFPEPRRVIYLRSREVE